MPINPELSKKLLELKEESGLTFKQIGDEVGSSEANVRRYIKGEAKVPDRPLLVSIIKAMGGDPAFLLPKADAPAGTMDIGVYEKLKADFEKQLSLWHTRYDNELENLKHTTGIALTQKDEWIKRLTEEVAELKRSRRRMVIAVTILAALLLLFICAFAFRNIV